MFSRPESSGWKPDPTSSSEAVRPFIVMLPPSGYRMRASILSSVDLPEPLRPINPNVEPLGTSNETSLTAQNSSKRALRPRMMVLFNVLLRSA